LIDDFLKTILAASFKCSLSKKKQNISLKLKTQQANSLQQIEGERKF
jgi:hypothetical protein